MRIVTGTKSRRTGTAAPPPGSYRATIAGQPAVIRVEGDAVYAMWFRSTPGGSVRPHQAAWDVIGGRFQALSDGEPVSCSYVPSSRT